MEKKIVVVLVAVLCCSAPSFGLSFMGPPKAGLEQGQFGVGANFSYSEMDVEVSGYGLSDTADVDTTALLADIGYGVINQVEVFGRVGVSSLEAEDFDGDFEFAYGFGTKVTIAEQDPVTWGALFQIGWLEGDDTVTGFIPGYGIVTADQEIDAYEIQIAVGPTYEAENMRVYGGPFLHLVDGDYDADILGGPDLSFDVEQESEIGGYIGAQFDLAENSAASVEFQFTADAWAIAAGVGFGF
ncbi:MAG: hypothetical protein ACYS67_08220 [Planctomycetota bacterium]|jgi:hypothetical protein